jgi:single-stranded-DNA-specific exonuclease
VLPSPTASEAAFERLLATFGWGGEQPDAISADRAPMPADAVTASPIVGPAHEPDAGEILDELFANSRRYLEREPYALIGDAGSFNSKVVGVSFEGRQDTVAGLRAGDALDLVRQPDNVHDPHAIAVRFGILHIGYLRKEIARRLAPNIDGGARYEARVTGVTGGRDGKHTGVNILVRRLGDSLRRAGARAATSSDSDAIRVALIGEAPIRDAQLAVLDRVREGANTLAILGTGRGKSFCFQLPAAERALDDGRKTLVFYPLRALANDQFEMLDSRLAPLGLRVFRANGGVDGDERDALDAALETGTWDVMLSTPEFAEFHREVFLRSCNRPSLVVVDEAHHAFESRHRPAYGTLGDLIGALGSPQVLALTATANDAAFQHVRRVLGIERWVIDPTVRENLHVVDARGTEDKLAYIRRARDDAGKAIVYCNSRSEVTKVAERLRAAFGNVVAFYHAGMGRVDRGLVEDLFRRSEVRFVAATSAFGEGIDLPDVRDVFLYHLNFSFTEFNQQAGRAGRDGQSARIHLLYGEGDRRINDYILARSAPTIAKLRELYRGMRGLAGPEGLRMTHEDIARTLELEMVDGSTVGAALRIFEEAGLVQTGRDDDGRYVRFREAQGRVDLTQTTRYAEGEAERESFARFCTLALEAPAPMLEAIVNRPIFPDGVALLR